MITCKGKLGDRSEFPTYDEGMVAGIVVGEKITSQTEGQTTASFDIKKALLFGGLILVGVIVLRRIL